VNLEPFENLDRLLQVEFRPEGLPAGLIARFHRLVRGEQPLTLLAANTLLALPVGARVALITGLTFEHLPRGEIDGPVGAAVLAHALTGLDRRAEVLVEAPLVPVVAALRDRLGGRFEIVDTARWTQGEVAGAAAGYDAAIAIEKLGKNARGVRHSIMGTPLPPEVPSLDEFVAALNDAGRPTIGIGDGGNEIGFGAIYERAREIVPRGAACGCPCAGGIVTATATGLLLPANVSNFGVYAICAALAILTRKIWLVPTGEAVVGLIQAAVAEGCLEGGSARPGVVGDDGIPAGGVAAFVALLGTIVGQTYVTFERRF
jgi:D-glutamate cyclase